ncbi:MAG: MFS transporter [Clostridia bacterium]|nr:MFS transporter [Clostridia bacterium]
MISLLLAIIYMAFISLGLPDSLLGSAWPIMQGELSVPLSFAGIISATISIGTIISSLSSDYITKKLGAGLVTAISVLMTALALLGFSLSDSFTMLIIMAVPYGLGAGAVDAALNNFVALNFSSRHMSWLHAFWGVGVSISPYIMSHSLTNGLGWHTGYRTVFIIQIILSAIIFLSIPLWRKGKAETEQISSAAKMSDVIKIPGVKMTLICFFLFCAIESTAGLWATSFMVDFKGVNPETAARFAALFYLGETAGRFINGFIADKFGDKTMIKTGIIGMLLGVLLMFIPSKSNITALAGLVITGLGAAPVYPCIIHSTPNNFGAENSQALVGIQMASAYTGSTLMPPLFGIIAQNTTLGMYPVYLGIMAVLMFVLNERLNRILKKRNKD